MSANAALKFEYISDVTGFRSPNAFVARLGGPLRRKRDLLRALAAGLKFPKYFGYNWDALEECLCDLSWLPAGETIVLLHEQIPLDDKRHRAIYIDVLRSAQQVHHGRLRVIFPANSTSEF